MKTYLLKKHNRKRGFRLEKHQQHNLEENKNRNQRTLEAWTGENYYSCRNSS